MPHENASGSNDTLEPFWRWGSVNLDNVGVELSHGPGLEFQLRDHPLGRADHLISQNVFMHWFQRVNSETKSSTCRLLLLIETLNQ
jgi:hypothetical protein